jgi:hypothetical protein
MCNQEQRRRLAGGTLDIMLAPNASVFPSRLTRAREIITDLLIATALIWSLPLLLGAGAGLIRLLLN